MRISLHFSSDIVIWCCFVRNRVGDRWTITLLFWSERKVVLRMKTCSIVAIAIKITMLTNGCSTKNQPTMAGNLNDVCYTCCYICSIFWCSVLVVFLDVVLFSIILLLFSCSTIPWCSDYFTSVLVLHQYSSVLPVLHVPTFCVLVFLVL